MIVVDVAEHVQANDVVTLPSVSSMRCTVSRSPTGQNFGKVSRPIAIKLSEASMPKYSTEILRAGKRMKQVAASTTGIEHDVARFNSGGEEVRPPARAQSFPQLREGSGGDRDRERSGYAPRY